VNGYSVTRRALSRSSLAGTKSETTPGVIPTLPGFRIRGSLQRSNGPMPQSKSAFGHRARPLFRAPFGARNERVLKVAHGMGYRSIYWSIDSLDAIRPAISSVSIVSNILKEPDETLDGAIVRFNLMSATRPLRTRWARFCEA